MKRFLSNELVKTTIIFVVALAVICFTPLKAKEMFTVGDKQFITHTVHAAANRSADFNSDSFPIPGKVFSTFIVSSDNSLTFLASAKLQASLDNSNWEDIASTDTAITGTDNIYWSYGDVGYLYGRVSITNMVGSANLTIRAVVK